ncbi:tetratricopeptide repeat protein [Legionella londiniensis]|uniref:Cytochrome c type biogenesis protein CcmH n=1 Tax=Legionella londiniensis TaxID=45068 RepID=A0A0W0VME5_9GAMM|nr:hypothetical protein [Legionella londiniensis]KTD21203.1 cytochrome c type biogenesis protein CcmH [Legionella londiniensis]STX93228.1 cytochrome c type biogenesis protein CcmH [Legionella londiniensis]
MREWFLLIILGCLLCLALAMALYPLRKRKKNLLIVSPLLISAALVLYWYWGAFNAWHHFLQQEANREQILALMQTIRSPEELIAKLKARLNNKPESAKGWYLLGRLYASQNKWIDANRAFATARKLKPDEISFMINYAQSLWQLNQRRFNEDIVKLFKEVLSRDAKQPDALAMLAMDAFMRHDYYSAIDYWQRLLQIVEPGSEDDLAIRKAIAKAEQNIARK